MDALYFQPADVEVCSAIQAIWLHAGTGPADERLKGVCERANELNKIIEQERQDKIHKMLDVQPEKLDEISKKQKEKCLTRNDSVGARADNVRGGRGGWAPLAREESLKLFIQSMKDTKEDTGTEEFFDIDALTMSSEFSYVASPEGTNAEKLKLAVDEWFSCHISNYKDMMQADTEGKQQDPTQKTFNGRKARLAKDFNISESQAANLFAKRLNSWRREEREILVTVRNNGDKRKTKTVCCKIKNLTRLSASQVQAELRAELRDYTWNQSSPNYEDDEDDDAGQTGKHNNGSEPLVPLVSITVQGGKGSGKYPQKTFMCPSNRVSLFLHLTLFL